MEHKNVDEITGNDKILEPQTATEKQLASMWFEIFGISDITLDSDFFDLGGNSLTAIKLLTRIEDTFGEGVLSPDTLFSTGQLGSLAAAIDAAITTK